MALETHYWGNYVSAVVACGKSIGSFGLLVYLQRASVVRWGSNKNMRCNRATGPRATLACVLLLVYEPAVEMSKSCNIQRAEVKKY